MNKGKKTKRNPDNPPSVVIDIHTFKRSKDDGNPETLDGHASPGENIAPGMQNFLKALVAKMVREDLKRMGV